MKVGKDPLKMRKVEGRKSRIALTSLILFSFWVVLSGHFDAFHLGAGIFCSLIVAMVSYKLLFSGVPTSKTAIEAFRFLRYLPWLFGQIILANLHVAYLALHPKMPIYPRIIRFKTILTRELSLVLFANSITLTPGTITVEVREGEYFVHALSKKVANDLLKGDMERRVAAVFEE